MRKNVVLVVSACFVEMDFISNVGTVILVMGKNIGPINAGMTRG